MQKYWVGFDNFSAPPPLETDKKCDYLIVGGGITGLSIAYHLLKITKGGYRVVLIDALAPGGSASGRNSGMLGPGVGLQFHRLVKKYGITIAINMFSESLHAVRYAIEEILNSGLDCDLQPSCQLKVAKNNFTVSRLKSEYKALTSAGFNIFDYEGDLLLDKSGSKAYDYGLEYEKTAVVNPIKLVQSLIEKIINMGGEVHFNTYIDQKKIDEFSKSGSIVTAGGVVSYKKLIIATNGFSGDLNSHKNRIIPISTSLIMSAPLADSKIHAVGLKKNIGVIDTSRLFNYFRVTNNNQVLFGGGKPIYSKEKVIGSNKNWQPHEKIYDDLIKNFHKLFPTEKIFFPLRWSGTIGATLDNLPVVNVSSDEIDVLVGWCGHGLAMSLYFGEKYAKQQLDFSCKNTLPWIRRKSPYLSPKKLLSTATLSYIQYMAKADDMECWLSRN